MDEVFWMRSKSRAGRTRMAPAEPDTWVLEEREGVDVRREGVA